MLVPVSVVSLKHIYVVATDHRSGSRTVTHMDGGGCSCLVLFWWFFWVRLFCKFLLIVCVLFWAYRWCCWGLLSTWLLLGMETPSYNSWTLLVEEPGYHMPLCSFFQNLLPPLYKWSQIMLIHMEGRTSPAPQIKISLVTSSWHSSGILETVDQ